MTVVNELTIEDFDIKVLKNNKVTVVDFWAPWCGYCQRMMPIYETLAAELGGSVDFYKVNTDEQIELAKIWKIEVLPTFAIFKDGKVMDRPVGGMSPVELKEKITAHS